MRATILGEPALRAMAAIIRPRSATTSARLAQEPFASFSSGDGVYQSIGFDAV